MDVASHVCIESGEPLVAAADGSALISPSGRRYPVLNGIPLLVRRPEGLVHAFVKGLDDARASFERERASLQALAATAPVRRGTSARIDRALTGRAHNLALVERFMEPAREFLRGRQHSPDVVDLLSCAAAGQQSPYWWMLDYFYQDWGGTADFAELSELIASTLKLLKRNGNRLLVLGAGACGLARDCARQFEHTSAVDLSIPSLLLAKAVFRGEQLDLRVERAALARVTVPRIAFKATAPVDFVVADVNWLPFAKGSVSAVLTQYLMDIVADPMHIATEIGRVLEPGGVWINFSNPLRMPDDPPGIGRTDISEMAELLEPRGWTIERAERRQFRYLNTDGLSRDGGRSVQDVHFFAARKSESDSVVANALPGGTPPGWDWVPRRAAAREVHFLERRRIRLDGAVDSSREVQLPPAGSMALSPQSADFFERLVQLIDGRRSLREIFRELPGQGAGVGEGNFLEIFQYLIRHHGLLRA